jgi:phage tail protein X
MNRYNYTYITKDQNNNVRRYLTTRYANIPTSIDDEYIITKRGDRLDLLAYKYYNDVTKWFIIAVANNLGKGSMAVPPGIQLRIPMNTIIFEDTLKTNNF